MEIAILILCMMNLVLGNEVDLVINDLGCWKDNSPRAVTDQDANLGGGNYKQREDAIQKCAKYAHSLGYDVFAVQDGGWCATAADARNTYKRYGPATNCGSDGEGGALANQVYEINKVYKVNYRYVGCYADKGDRAIEPLESRFVSLHDTYSARTNAIQKCALAAVSLHHKVFAIQASGWCASSASAHLTYDKYGPANNCGLDGEGGGLANAVYEITDGHQITLKQRGCFKDTAVRAIPTLEGTSVLVGNYNTRAHAIEQCARYASSLGYRMMAIQDGGWCASSKHAELTYDKYGPSESCLGHGKGGHGGNFVYSLTVQEILTIQDMGCWADDTTHTISVAEGKTTNLRDEYTTRGDAIAKCANYAHQQGYHVFSIQNGGQCLTASDAGDTYKRIGPSTSCLHSGKGGPWANQVYEIIRKTRPFDPLNEGQRILITV